MPRVAMLRRSPYSAVVRLLLVEDDVVIARELLLRWGSRGWTAQARASLVAAEEAATAAGERLRLAEGRYETGAGNAIELGDAQLGFTAGEAQQVQAAYNLASARARLLAALGRP